jgi:signal transduction histidine kinase
MTAALELSRRIDEAVQALVYLAIGVVLGAAGWLAILALAVGAVLSIAWIGLPLLLGAVFALRRLAELDRRTANAMLDAHIAVLPGAERREGSLWRRSLETLNDGELWRIVGHLALKLPLALVGLAVGLAPVVLVAALLVLGAQGIGSLGASRFLGPWSLGPGLGVVLCLLAVPALVLATAILDALRDALRALTRALLAPRTPPGSPVREMLAESLGDRTLSIAYWLPDRATFVDDDGRPVELPHPGSGRAWTSVERDGRRVAAIVHDAELDASAELVHAAAAAAALAIDNERLKADLRARVEELRVSRVRIVQAGDEARRRLERDLHDGAQQRLVALSLDLRALKARVRGTEVEPVIDELGDKLAVALAELRELARGIHPAVLTERGLGPAIEALSERLPLTVENDVAVEGRLTPAIEAAAYFVVAEGLTNVVKYALVDRARVVVRRERDMLVVSVADDGTGGADPAGGTGLRGLNDRLAALDGTLEVHSPDDAGTRLLARIPCGAPLSRSS